MRRRIIYKIISKIKPKIKEADKISKKLRCKGFRNVSVIDYKIIGKGKKMKEMLYCWWVK